MRSGRLDRRWRADLEVLEVIAYFGFWGTVWICSPPFCLAVGFLLGWLLT
jgi:hypothetical protein